MITLDQSQHLRIDNYRELLLEAQNITTHLSFFPVFWLVRVLLLFTASTRASSVALSHHYSGLKAFAAWAICPSALNTRQWTITILASAQCHPDQLENLPGNCKTEDKLSYEAKHVSLTGFVNRNSFNQALANILAHQPLTCISSPVLFLDLDGLRTKDSFSTR
jgi:hypothetical protein